jgi:hypothetical protein
VPVIVQPKVEYKGTPANLRARAGSVLTQGQGATPVIVQPKVDPSAVGKVKAEVGRAFARAPVLVAIAAQPLAVQQLRSTVSSQLAQPLTQPVIVATAPSQAQQVQSTIAAQFSNPITQTVVVQTRQVPGGAVSGTVVGGGGVMASGIGRDAGKFVRRAAGLALVVGAARTATAYSDYKSDAAAAGDNPELLRTAEMSKLERLSSIPLAGPAARGVIDAGVATARIVTGSNTMGYGLSSGDIARDEAQDKLRSAREETVRAVQRQADELKAQAQLIAEDDPFKRSRLEIDNELKGAKDAAKQYEESLRKIATTEGERKAATDAGARIETAAMQLADTQRAKLRDEEALQITQSGANAKASVEAEKLRIEGRTYDAEIVLLKRREEEILATVKGSADKQVALAEVTAVRESLSLRQMETARRANFDMDTRERVLGERKRGRDGNANIITEARATIKDIEGMQPEFRGRAIKLAEGELRQRFGFGNERIYATDFDATRSQLRPFGEDDTSQTLDDMLTELRAIASNTGNSQRSVLGP